MCIFKILPSIIAFASLGNITHACIKLSEYFPAETSIEYYTQPSTKCAINAVYFSIKKTLDKSISIEKISQNFEKFEGPPYSILDIVSILDEYSLKTLPSKLIPSTEVFMHRFNNGILYLKKPGRKIGHFSFCFRGKDGKLWIADPAFGDKCIEFTPESEIFKSFTGIILKIENPK